MNENWKTKLKNAWNENPLLVIAVVGGALGAVAKVIDATSQAQSRRAYSKMINRRY